MEDARRIAERIRRDVGSTPFRVMGGRELLTVTISIGVAACAGPGDTPESLLKRADEGVYVAKAAGRDRVVARAA
jgi:two-component system cell cycle response regulator